MVAERWPSSWTSARIAASAFVASIVTPDVFELIDWPAIFGVRPTNLEQALTETFRDPVFSLIVLEF